MKKYQYRRNGREWLSTLLCGCLLFGGLGILFYRHIVGALCLTGLLPVYIRLDRIRREKQYQEELTIQFKDALQSMTGALQAGYSLERAVPYAAEELTQLYREDAPMVRALQELTARLGVNETVEQAFSWLAEETEIEDIREFVQVLTTAKRTGGNVIKVMLHTADCVSMRQEVKREIQTLLSGKRLEANLMIVLPPGILLYLWIAMPDMVAVLYHNLQGILLMTGLLLLYGGSYLWTRRILQIKI
ncbi:MAG: type II secretion system F family protein [Lachnospiraceae bacterium]|nr:type II secretion system F family protein [Lachnospiraceae bacterium]